MRMMIVITTTTSRVIIVVKVDCFLGLQADPEAALQHFQAAITSSSSNQYSDCGRLSSILLPGVVQSCKRQLQQQSAAVNASNDVKVILNSTNNLMTAFSGRHA